MILLKEVVLLVQVMKHYIIQDMHFVDIFINLQVLDI